MSNLSPFIVIPSPEGTNEKKKPAHKRVESSATSTPLFDDDKSEELRQDKVVAIGEYKERKKKHKKPPPLKQGQIITKEQRAVASYNKIQEAETAALLRDNFKKKI